MWDDFFFLDPYSWINRESYFLRTNIRYFFYNICGNNADSDLLGSSEVSVNLYCNSRTSVLGRLRDYLRILMKRSVRIFVRAVDTGSPLKNGKKNQVEPRNMYLIFLRFTFVCM